MKILASSESGVFVLLQSLQFFWFGAPDHSVRGRLVKVRCRTAVKIYSTINLLIQKYWTTFERHWLDTLHQRGDSLHCLWIFFQRKLRKFWRNLEFLYFAAFHSLSTSLLALLSLMKSFNEFDSLHLPPHPTDHTVSTLIFKANISAQSLLVFAVWHMLGANS